MITCYFDHKYKPCTTKGMQGKAFLRHVVTGAIIVKNKQILLVKRASHLDREPNKWTIPGGYLDQGETIRKGLLREILEETGYKTTLISLFRINDNPKRDRGNVDFIFLAKTIKKIAKPDRETSKVKWFSFDRLPKAEDIAFDHWDNIQLYLKYLKKKFPLPIL